MARCYYLDWKNPGSYSSINDGYFCKLCPVKKLTEAEVKHVCNPEYGECYKNCPIYKDRRW